MRSPIVQCCLDAQKVKESAVQEPSTVPLASVFNFTVSDNLVDLLHPACPAPASAPPMLTAPSTVDKMPLKASQCIGPDMLIAEFCTLFGLHASILTKLKENGYDFACNLCFITVENLAEMGFKLGERAALLDAVEQWSVPVTV